MPKDATRRGVRSRLRRYSGVVVADGKQYMPNYVREEGGILAVKRRGASDRCANELDFPAHFVRIRSEHNSCNIIMGGRLALVFMVFWAKTAGKTNEGCSGPPLFLPTVLE